VVALRGVPDDEPAIRQKYLDEIKLYSKLTLEQEQDLGRIIQDPASTPAERGEAIDELVRGNLRFVVWYVIHKVRATNVSFLDLVSEGNLGLLQAAVKFDPGRGVRFSSYAVWWIRQAIQHALSDQTGAVRLPAKQAALVYRVGRAREGLSRSLQREPTTAELCKETGLAEAEVEWIRTLSRSSESLSREFGGDADRTLEDKLEQTSVASADDELLRRSSIQETRAILAKLPKNERAVLCRRFGIPADGSEGECEPMTLQQVGDEMKVSRERVRQIEAQAIRRLKQTLGEKTLQELLA
jgi:RNA polymerase primary sigma factor